MDKLFEHAKAFITVVFGFIVYAATRISSEHPVLPDVDPLDVKGWLLLVAGLVVGYAAVSRTPNITHDPVKAKTESMVYRPRKARKPRKRVASIPSVADHPTDPTDSPPSSPLG
jgi:hypothetical protein